MKNKNIYNLTVGPTLTIKEGRFKDTGYLKLFSTVRSHGPWSSRYYSSSKAPLIANSKEWCKEEKTKILKNELRVTFEDMSKMKNKKYG